MNSSNWDKWWEQHRDKGIAEFFMKHYFKYIFAEYIKKFLSKNDLILEFGCGSGHIASQLASQGYNVTGIDYSVSAPAKFNRKFRFISGDIREKPFIEKFNLVYSQGVMEHYSDEEFNQILKVMTEIAEKVLILVPSNLSLFRIYDPIKDDKNKIFFTKKKLYELISRECDGVKVQYLLATGFLSIAGFATSKR
jgi:SAM-dependent methyltransferase